MATAVSGDVLFTYPSWHPMMRWKGSRRFLPLLGRYGDVVSFSSLPTSVQTLAMAEAFGAVGSAGEQGFEACGSPNEVANELSLGHRYKFQLHDDDRGGSGIYRPYGNNNGKSMVWTNVVLSAPDQLRHRMAFALSQV